METRRFFAENSQLAFQMVKDELGADALIIENRALPNGVELIATCAEVQNLPELMSDAAPTQLNQKSDSNQVKTDSVEKPVKDAASRQDMEDFKRSMMSELSAIKIGSWQQQDKSRYKLFQYLVKLGIHVSLVSKLTSGLSDAYSYEQNRKDVLQELIYSINTGADINIPVDELTGIVMLHGLTGAGKTTTISKIAAQAVAAHGNDNVVLVCADNVRMGAHQQLLGYGKIFEVPVLHARKSSDLGEILNALKDKRLVLVDHAGITPDRLTNILQTPAFECSLPNIKHYLTLSATTQATVINRLLTAEWKHKLNGVIVTKIDEAAQLGEIISCLIENHAPAAFMSAGQNIQKDLYSFNSEVVVTKAVLLGETAQSSSSEKINNTVKTKLHKQLDFTH